MNDFTDRLIAAAKQTEANDNSAEPKKVLFMAATAVNKLIANVRVVVEYEIGHSVNFGLQHNLIVRKKDGQFRDLLLRAYIPPTGYPTRLDLLGDDLIVCKTKAEIEDQLLALFEDPGFKAKLEMYGKLGKDPFNM